MYWSELKSENQKYVSTELLYEGCTDNIFFTDKMAKCSKKGVLQRYLSPSVRSDEPFVFHSSYYRICKAKNAINITTIHDFTYEKFRKDIVSLIHKFQKRYAILHSAGIICISQNTYRDFMEMYPRYAGLVRVIPNGFSGDYFVLPDRKPALPSGTVLFVGARSGYKNFDYAVRLVSQLGNYSLSIIGGGELSRNEIDSLNEFLPGRYTVEGAVDNAKLNQLYNESFCLLYPSLYEGFGIPVLEAQAAGCPVVCTNSSSLPEVAGSAAVFITGNDIAGDADKVSQLKDAVIREKLIANGLDNVKKYSWKRCSRETFGFYEEVFESLVR